LTAIPQPSFSYLLPTMYVPNAGDEEDDEEGEEDEVVV
jgi:hypothetical protein